MDAVSTFMQQLMCVYEISVGKPDEDRSRREDNIKNAWVSPA